jgi:hypothetical protein
MHSQEFAHASASCSEPRPKGSGLRHSRAPHLLQFSASLSFIVGFMPCLLRAMDLQPETVKAWEAYIQNVDIQMRGRASEAQSFLWIDESNARKHVRRGELVVAPVLNHGVKTVPGGLIHHWIGAVFIPHATVERLLSVLHDYDRYKDVYKPVVADSRLLACNGGNSEISLTWHRHILWVNAAVEGRCQARQAALSTRRGYSIADMKETREIAEYGHSGEHFLPPDTGSGFIWRMHSITRYEESDGGLYLEEEAIALTRDIPPSFRWLVSPIVSHLSADSLTTMLRETRDAVNALPVTFGAVDLCPKPAFESSEAKTVK